MAVTCGFRPNEAVNGVTRPMVFFCVILNVTVPSLPVMPLHDAKSAAKEKLADSGVTSFKIRSSTVVEETEIPERLPVVVVAFSDGIFFDDRHHQRAGGIVFRLP